MPVRAILTFAVLLLLNAPLRAQDLSITPMVEGLRSPWAIGFLPDGGVLVTEKAGRLLFFVQPGATPIEVSGLPEIHVQGQGGLLDVMIPRNFTESRRVWLSFAAAARRGAGTAAGYGQLSADGTRLEGFRMVHPPMAAGGGRHFGSRLVEGVDGTVFLTTGDRGQGSPAQDPARAEGKVLAFGPDGMVLTDDAGAVPGLYSLGHRNIQGAALDLEGNLWVVEHGARGGDELNRIQRGQNYGWPVISYGMNYDGSRIGEGQRKEGMEQPVLYWDPSIAPSGLVVHSGRMFPDWKGNFFTGSLNSDFISRIDPGDGYSEERIQSEETARVRDIVEAPDGAIWFLSETRGIAYRIAPRR
ncbi:MAG: PQQ-dependent sugar dehydrogenase [Pseudorhodobacter sp.]